MANVKLSQINGGTPTTYTPATDVFVGVRSGTTDLLFDGVAAGPGVSTANHLAAFGGTDGLTLIDSGLLIANIGLLSGTQTFTGAKTFTNSMLKLLGSSTGATTFTSDNAGATNYTMHVPAADDTLAVLGATQTFTQNLHTTGGVETGNTTNTTAVPWKLGDVVTAAAVVDATQYLEVMVNGVLFKLAVVV